MIAIIQILLHLVQAALSGYALNHASRAIPRLQQYETKSEKAAQYSNTAARELHKTRSTQTVGTVAILFSLVASSALALHLVSPGWKSLALNLAAGVATAWSSIYIGDFWDHKAKVPLVKGYNEAIDSTKAIREQLALLGVTWATSILFDIWRLIVS